MAANKIRERMTGINLLMPSAAVIAPGDLLIWGQGTHVLIGIANDGQNLTTKPPYYSNDGYLSLDTEGAFNLTVSAFVSSSPSAGAAVNRGDALYADGGTFDITTGITYGSKITKDSTGTFIGLAEGTLAAGTTGTIGVTLKNAV